MVIVAVAGEVDLYSASLFEESLVVAGSRDPTAIIVDLDGVSFMDLAGVHVLLQFAVSEGDRDRLSFTPGSPQVRRLLDLSGVRRYLAFVRAPAPGRSGAGPTARLRLTGP